MVLSEMGKLSHRKEKGMFHTKNKNPEGSLCGLTDFLWPAGTLRLGTATPRLLPRTGPRPCGHTDHLSSDVGRCTCP